VLEGAWLFTGRERFRTLYLFWLRIFALSFGMGVVSGVVMSYQFGTNWSAFSARAGSVVGPLMAFEVLTAFFLEASFLGVMLFGWRKVGRRLHFVATCAVAAGTLLSAFWIISANSWMQHPVAFEALPDGQLAATDWVRVIFSPTFPPRFFHMVLAAYLTTALVVGGASAWQLLRRPDQPESRTALRMAIGMFAVVAPLQLVIGDISGTVVADVQPAKLAALEGIWETRAGQPFHVLAWPDRSIADNRWDLSIPKLGSVIVKRDPNAVVQGLRDFPPDERPPAAVVFYAFRIMVGLGLLMIVLGFWGLWEWRRGGPERSRPFLWATIAMSPAGFVCVVSGWVLAEVGRQPWVVYGVMRTAAAASPVQAGAVSASLLGFMLVYAAVFGVGALYILRLIAQGPVPGAAEPSPAVPRAPGSAMAKTPDQDPHAPPPPPGGSPEDAP
jgi:cytochrome d ubiquinol oxidase subunit I